jgi:serine/threonine protein kinase
MFRTLGAAHMDLLGTRLGRYELRERLGKGGMAIVYKGWDTNLERPVAIKVLHEYLVDDNDFRTRFEREAKVVASLDHPNIVQVYDFDVAERNGEPMYYMVMKHIPGKSLRALMEAGVLVGQRLSITEITNVMNGVCSALQYAHQRGMVHRDVTPGNILFDEQGRAVLADFGIARIVTSQRVTQSGTTSGTPLYMAPEQGIGEAGDQRSDLYSLGVILYEMLAGRPPYDAESAVAVLLKHINEPIPSLLPGNSNIPAALDDVVMRALSKDAESRFQSASEFMSAFEMALSGSAATRRQDLNRTVAMSPLTVTSPAPKRRPMLLYSAAAVIALAILVGVGTLVSNLVNRTPPAPPTLTLAVPALKTRAFAPSMTSGPRSFSDDFSDAERAADYWPITLDDPDIYRQIESGSYHIRHMLPAAAVTTIYFPTATYGTQFVYSADFTLSDKNPPDTGTGIVFRFRDDDHYYVFAVNGMGQVSLWSRINGEWLELRGLSSAWTDTTAAKPLGQTNHLRLVDDRRTLQGYVNDQLVIEVQTEPKLESGAIGIYLASSTSPANKSPFADVQVDNFDVQELRKTTPTVAVTAAPATQEATEQKS